MPSRTFTGPVFIVGLPRSGTKLLRTLLNAHLRIGIPLNETEFFPQWVRCWPQWGDLRDPRAFHAFFETVTRSIYFVSRREEHGTGIDEATWYRACRDFTPAAVFEALIRCDAAVPSDGVWGDKSPGYLVHLPLLNAHFPDARFVHIIRDARDHCLSMEVAFGKSKIRAALRWRQRIVAARQAATAFPARYLEVRYEDLLTDPATVLQKICAHLDLPYDPVLIEKVQVGENLGEARGKTGILRDNTGKWRQRLSPAAVARIESVAGALLQDLGYPVTLAGERDLSRLHRLLLQAHDGVQIVRREALKRGWGPALVLRLRLFRETGRLGD